MIAKNTLYLTSALVGQKFLSFIYFTLLARFLGAESIGKYTFALAFTTIFSILTDLGLTPILIREIARAREKTAEFLSSIIAVKFFLCLLSYTVVLGAAFLIGYPPLTLKLIALAGVVMLLDAFHLSFYGVLRGFQVLRFEAVGLVAGQGITLLAGSLALMFRLPLPAFLVALGLGSAWNVAFSASVLRRQGIPLRPALKRKTALMLLRLALPFALAGIFVRVYSFIDTVILQYLKGDTVVGFYSVPYKITYAFQFLPAALGAAVYPALSFAWREENAPSFDGAPGRMTGRTRWIFDRALIYSIILSFPIAFGIALLAPEIILTIYGVQFAPSILPLQISIFGLIFMFLYFPVGALLNASDRQATNTTFLGITMVLNIILNLFLIPRLAAVGASLAAVLTNAFLFLGTLLASARFMPPSRVVAKTFFKVTLAVATMVFIVVQVKGIIFWPWSVGAGAAVYIGMILLLRAVTREDMRKFFELFTRTKPPLEGPSL